MVFYYQQMLMLAPGNAQAQTGLQAIAEEAATRPCRPTREVIFPLRCR